MLKRPFWMVALVVLVAIPAAAQQSDETFTITGVPIDATSTNASQAREIAIANGEQDALKRLFDNMVLKSDQPFLPSIDASQISGLVDGISVSDEKVSRTRYLASLTVYFKAEEVRTLLQRAGIAFSETISKPVLVLPVLETAGFVTLWTDPNPWLASWASYDQANSHMPFILPKGDAREAASISAQDVITGDPETVQRIAATYQTSEVYLAYANLYLDQDTGDNVMRVLFMRFGENPAVLGDDVMRPDMDLPPEQQTTAMMKAAVASTVNGMKEAWKRQTQVHYGSEVSLNVLVPVTTLADWVHIERKLADAPVVRAVDVQNMTVHQARIAIKYLGSPQQLILALAQSDLQLAQNSTGDWVMTASDTHTSR